MLTRYEIAGGKLAENGEERSVVWVFTNPDDAEKQRLVSDFKIDEHNVASALDPEEPSRLEYDPDCLSIIFKLPKNYSAEDLFQFKVASMGLFLTGGKMVVVTSENIPLFMGKIFLNTESVHDLLLKQLYSSIRHYMDHLKIINMTTDDIEKKISVSMENKYLLNLFGLEKSLVYYLNAINSNAFVFEKLRNSSTKIGFSPRNMEFLDDLIIENNQCYRQAEIYSNILASLMDARVSIVSNNLNILMKTLNLITIGIMVPTLVVSAFSMNVTIPIQKHPYAFWIIIAIAAISLGGVMFWWKKIERGGKS